METKREKLQNLARDIVVLMGNLNDLEKTFSRLKNEAIALYEQIDGKLDLGEEG